MDFPGGSDGKASAYSVRDPGKILGSGRSPGEENGNYSILAWRIPETEELGGLQSMGSQSRTRLNDFTVTFHFSLVISIDEDVDGGGGW